MSAEADPTVTCYKRQATITPTPTITPTVTPTTTPGASGHPNMYLDKSEIDAIKTSITSGGPVLEEQKPWKIAYDNLMVDANTALNANIQSVTYGGPIPPSGDIHDEYTIDSDRTDYSALINVSKYVRSLGLAYAITGNSKYAEKALVFIRKWTIDPDTKMNPKFTTYGSRIELSITMPGMFYGADLIWNYPGWDNAEKEEFKKWTRQMIASAKTWSAEQNFENWRLVFISSASIITEDQNSRNYAFAKWKDIISSQMDTDGKMVLELNRETSLSYSLYAVNAMIQTAEIARHYGVDLYNYKLEDGRGLELALDYHARYVINPSLWQYSQTRTYDGANAALYELAYKFKQKPSYLAAMNRWGRPMYETRTMGPVTLTHSFKG